MPASFSSPRSDPERPSRRDAGDFLPVITDAGNDAGPVITARFIQYSVIRTILSFDWRNKRVHLAYAEQVRCSHLICYENLRHQRAHIVKRSRYARPDE